jgi:DNA-directed RNA polymerase subunit E'/Rpb7
MDIISPYINTEHRTRVELYPNQMNNDVYKYLKSNLKNNIENKCNKYGYVIKVYKILEYKNGLVDPDNFMATAVYEVTFACRMCIPNVNTKIMCEISRINRELISCTNGPIIVIIHNKNINPANFLIDNNGNLKHIKNNKNDIIKATNIVKISIIAARSDKGGKHIKIYGYLDDIATVEEIDSYKKDISDNSVDELNVDKNLPIEYNNDDFV